jgi:hypothetical protein
MHAQLCAWTVFLLLGAILSSSLTMRKRCGFCSALGGGAFGGSSRCGSMMNLLCDGDT